MTSLSRTGPRPFWRPVSGRSFALVVAGAAMWGTDPLFRRGLALSLPAPTVVLVEHLLPVALVVPLLLRGLRRARGAFTGRDWIALIVLGCGSSAVATVLFTLAFTYGSPTTPVLLQQLQPLFAVIGARLLLGERARPRFGLYLVGGLAGAYLIAFADPAHVAAPEWIPALLTIAAAALWGTGTVLGRELSAKVPFGELTALRLGFGLIAAAVFAFAKDDVTVLAHLRLQDIAALVLLALIPGLASLLVYYRGLRGTPASAATLGELAFPLTAIIVGYVAFGDALSATQWIGVALLCTTMTVMGVTRPGGTPTGVAVPDEVREPVSAGTSGGPS